MPTNLSSDPTALERPRRGRMVFVSIVLGTCFVATAWGLRDAPVLWFAALRASLAGLVLVAVALVLRRPLPRSGRTWAVIALLGLVNGSLALGAMFGAAAGVSEGTAVVLANAQPLLILLPAWWWYGQRPTRATTFALVIGVGGVALMASAGVAGSGRGTVLALSSAGAATVGTLLARRLRAVDPIVLAGWHLVAGGAGLAIWAVMSEGAPRIVWTDRFVGVLLFLALAGTAGTSVVWFAEAGRSRLDQLTAWTLLVPVVGVLLAILILGERPALRSAVGIAAVVTALWFAQRPRLHRGMVRHTVARETSIVSR